MRSHDIVHDNTANASANMICGVDKWYDNHWAIDGGVTTLAQYKRNFDAFGWHYYHAWGGGMGPENLYVVTSPKHQPWTHMTQI